MTSPKYRKDNDLEVFKKDFSFADETWLKLKPGYNVRFKGNSAWLYPRESNLFELWVGPEYEWIKVHDKWYLTGKYECI